MDVQSEDLRNIEAPQAGFGGRAFFCDRYEDCLYHAACNDWPGFQCENCLYENRGSISFYLLEFFDTG